MRIFTILTFFLLPGWLAVNGQSTVSDREGNLYNTVTIGDQIWLKENLRVQSFNDGTTIPNVPLNEDWANLTTPGLAWYNNDQATYGEYGLLYNGYVVASSKNVCPAGWRIPSDGDWIILASYLGGNTVAGGKMKETGLTHWADPNTAASNESGFTALGSGSRFNHGGFNSIKIVGRWWASTLNPVDPTKGFLDRSIDNAHANLYSNNTGVFKNGFSIRCVRDVSTDVSQLGVEEQIKIYPVPFNETLTIEHQNNERLYLEVFNTTGTSVFAETLEKGTTRLSFDHLPAGIYIFRLKGSGKMLVKKLLKQ